MISFADTRLRAFGIAQSYAYEAPKPPEFGSAGRNWDDIGWRVEVEYHEIATRVRPVEWMELLRPLLPSKYSPLLPDGRGSQSIYLTELPAPLALALVDRPEHLRASHCKPWRDANNIERLDGENGLLLTPTVDHLFDRGFISFRNDGRLLVSPVAHEPSLARMGIPIGREFDAGWFSAGQARFLEFYRD